ncbi:hypothetical protein BC828DRAFT_401286 [Blastocladiella britannica]|nr:hypothetical protein BC828DRAFT_401286 [Blastocladiella britannica]
MINAIALPWDRAAIHELGKIVLTSPANLSKVSQIAEYNRNIDYNIVQDLTSNDVSADNFVAWNSSMPINETYDAKMQTYNGFVIWNRTLGFFQSVMGTTIKLIIAMLAHHGIESKLVAVPDSDNPDTTLTITPRAANNVIVHMALKIRDYGYF